jgi:hypothetical protein
LKRTITLCAVDEDRKGQKMSRTVACDLRKSCPT